MSTRSIFHSWISNFIGILMIFKKHRGSWVDQSLLYLGDIKCILLACTSFHKILINDHWWPANVHLGWCSEADYWLHYLISCFHTRILISFFVVLSYSIPVDVSYHMRLIFLVKITHVQSFSRNCVFGWSLIFMFSFKLQLVCANISFSISQWSYALMLWFD